MRILPVGGTGAIDRALVPRLVERGHEVTATTRSPERAPALAALGAEAAVADALEVAALAGVAEGVAPEVVLCQVTLGRAPAYASWHEGFRTGLG